MSNRGRAFWRMVGRRAWICAAVLAVLVGVLYLFVKEYGLSARFVLSPDGPQTDSVAVSITHRLKSPHLAKGGALSAMGGDFASLLAHSIAEPNGRVNNVLNSFSPDSSLLAMKKLCARAKDNEIRISYFSYDSLSALRTFDFYKNQCVGMLPKGFELREEECSSFLDNLSLGKWARRFPWRTSAFGAAILLAIWLLTCLIAWFRSRKVYGKKGIKDMRQASKVVGDNLLLGGIEEVSPFREKYGNALRWMSQTDDIAKKIREEAGETAGSMVNILGVKESDLYFFKRCGLLWSILKGETVHLMEYGQDIDASSTAYRYPDISRLKEENSGNMLVMVHPPLSECKVPRPYLDNASLNIILSNSEDLWPESYKALASDIPNCKVVLLGMPCGTIGVNDAVLKENSLKAQKDREYFPTGRHFRYIVLLSDSYSPSLVEKTCKNLYYSSTGEDTKEAESLMEVSTALHDYVVRPFRTTSSKILRNLELSASDADAVVMLKAGCTVSKGFLYDISCALAAGMESVQCRLKGKVPKGAFTGFAVTWYSLEALKSLKEEERSKFFMDYLADTSVFFL